MTVIEIEALESLKQLTSIANSMRRIANLLEQQKEDRKEVINLLEPMLKGIKND